MSAPWWKECVFYQIYPRSFQCGNGDGIGDLRGIISRLDYLKRLGVGAVWLCPVYDSPNADMGYDIRDYDKIMSEFGSMEDFDELLNGLHSRGIRLIMDLVVNHTSDEHPWFTASRSSRSDPRRDYYIWRDGKGGKEPNNCASFFTPSAWTYDARSGQWYLHLFSQKQPDLNWENPDMRREVYDMMNRWLNKGVDGFRMDVVSLFAKAPHLPDGDGEGYVFAPEHFAFQPRLHDFLREMRQECFDGRDCMCVGEATFADTERAGTLVSDGRELDMVFQFDFMDIDAGRDKWDLRPFDAAAFGALSAKWQKALDWNSLFLGNHDQPRAVSRFGCTDTKELRRRSAKLLAAAMYLQRGTPFIYQGEELGMTNMPFFSPDELRDIESINYLRSGGEWRSILAKGRDNARTPMQWSGEENAGFTTGTPWISVNPNYKHINVETESADPDSVLNFYRALISLRSERAVLRHGSFELLPTALPTLFAYRRTLCGDSVSVWCNFSGESAEIETDGEILLCNISSPRSGELAPYETRVLL